MLKERIADEEGVKRFCRIVAENISNLTKNQWQVLFKLLKLKISVVSKELITVSVALPPIRETETENDLNRLSTKTSPIQ